MYVFNYDPVTGAYTGGTPCDFDQMAPGEVLVPAWSTKNPPPREWDNAVNWPHYRPETDDWELRPLPVPEEVKEPEPPEAPPVERAEALQATLQAHVDAAARIVEELKKVQVGAERG